jgi:plastocyanin
MMKRWLAPLVLAAVLVLLAGCQVQSQSTSATGNTITMGPNNFEQTSIMIKAGQTITFVDDKATGSEHILVIGTQGVSQTEAGAPDFHGATGITFQPGQSWTSSPWTTPGTYHVTCTIHPTTMNLTVTVTT